MFTMTATAEASRTAASGQGVVASMWHTSNSCAVANTAKSIGGEGEKRFTVKSRDIGSSPMRFTDG